MTTQPRRTNFRRTSLFLGCGLLFVALPGSLLAGTRITSSVPANLRETRALDLELAQLGTKSRAVAKRIQQLQSSARSARKDLEAAARVTASIRSMDRRLGVLIRRLNTYRGVPQVRTAVKTLIATLKRLQSSIHAVRRNTDKVEKQVLIPLAKRLKTFEAQLSKPRAKLLAVATTADQSRVSLAQAARLANRSRTARGALEQSSRLMRPTVSTLARTVADVETRAYSVQRDVYSMRRKLAAFWTVRSSLAVMSRQLAPGEKVAGDLDRVLSKRIKIKIPVPPFKTVSFSVKQIVETPGKVLDVVLKPLEAIARKMLSPITKKLKIGIKPPKGLAALSRLATTLPRTSTGITRAMSQLESKTKKDLVTQADAFTRVMGQRLPRR